MKWHLILNICSILSFRFCCGVSKAVKQCFIQVVSFLLFSICYATRRHETWVIFIWEENAALLLYVLVSSVTAPLGVIDSEQECIQFLMENMHINLANQHPSWVKSEIRIIAESIISSIACWPEMEERPVLNKKHKYNKRRGFRRYSSS